MNTPSLHKAQMSILRSLRHTPAARYAALMRPTGLDSDVFKFHIRKLVDQKLVKKLDSGMYELTPTGKEFANNLSKSQRTVQKQPKLSVVVVVSTGTGNGKRYLFQQRLRSPYFGFWGCVSGPVQWGEPAEVAAQRELAKQTGLAADFVVRSFCRTTDYESGSNTVLEDKLFIIVEAVNADGELSNVWSKGKNAWMTLSDLKKQDKYFSSTCDFIDMIEAPRCYDAQQRYYTTDEY